MLHPTISVSINERDVLKLVLGFLEDRRFHIAQLALEREAGIINGKFTEDVLFLRQLILDGQWDSALDFVKPLNELEGFKTREFNFLVYKYKYFELLCIKQEPGPLQDNEFTIEEIVECLKELEQLCESGDEFRQLCALLTLHKLSDDEYFRNWNPSSARIECFHTVLPIVADFIGKLNPAKGSNEEEEEEKHADGERLLQLLIKGLFYEYAVDYCQAQAMEGKNAPKPKCKFTDLLVNQPAKLSSNDLSLISWLEVLGNKQFTVPFQQKAFNFHLENLKKPKLEAQWNEQILATPIKPHGQFPYSFVPHTKLKCAQQQFSQSMSASMAFDPGFYRNSSKEKCDRFNFRAHSMSQSTFPSIGVFSIQRLVSNGNGGGDERPHSLGNDAMRQSQIISDMLSESSAPSTARRSPPQSAGRQNNVEPQSQSLAIIGSSSPPTFTDETETISAGAGAARQELESFCRRNPPQTLLPLNSKKTANQSVSTALLPSVPELNTPSVDGPFPLATTIEGNEAIQQQMVQSRLFQEFQVRQQQQNMQTLYQQMPSTQPQYEMPMSAIMAPQCHPAAAPMINYPTTIPPIMPSIAERAPVIGGVIPQYQQQMPQPMVMLRTQQNPPSYPHNNYSISVEPPPLSSRPTSMIIPGKIDGQQGQLNTNRPRSYLDQPMPSDQHNWQQNAASQYYSMMSTIPIKERQARKGSLDDEEFFEEENQKTREENAAARCARSDEHSTINPVRFVPICQYEDAQAIRTVAFHPSGGHFAIGTNSRQLLLCRYPDVNAAGTHQKYSDPFPPEILLTRPKQHRGSVYCATFNQTGELLATGSNDKTIRLMSLQIDGDQCRIVAELELPRVHDGTVRDLIFMKERISNDSNSSQQSLLVSGGAGNCQLYVTDCHLGRTFQHLQGHTGPILGLNNWGSSTNFVSCSQDKTIRFWDLRASSATSVIWPAQKTSNSPVTSVCVDPSGKLLISGHEDATIMLFDICGGRTVQLFRPHGDEIRTVRLSNAAYYLLSGSYDKRIVITDMRGNLAEPLAYLPVAEHNDKVIQCRWHPRDFVFLSTSADKRAVLWALPHQPSNE